MVFAGDVKILYYAAAIVTVPLAVGTVLLVAGGIVKGVTHEDADGEGNLGAGDWLMIAGGAIIALDVACVLFFVFAMSMGRTNPVRELLFKLGIKL